MASYEKPVILVENDCMEGVYLASGENPAGGYECESQYMKGVWQPVSTSPWPLGGKKMIERGCEGCPAYNELKCNRNESWFQVYSGQHLMPLWEEKGKSPEDPWDSLWQ